MGVLAVIYTALSWYTGNVIANNIDSKIIDIEYNINHHQKFFNFYTSYSDYHQGIFSTTFYLKITAEHPLNLEKNNQQTKPNIIFNEQITVYHGPFPWSELKEFNLKPQLANAVYELTEKISPKLWQIANHHSFLNAKLSIRYDQSMQLIINTKPIDHINLTDKTLYKITAGHLIVNSDSSFNQFNLTSQLHHLKIKDKKLDINLDNFELSLTPLDATYQLTSSIRQLLIDRFLFQQYKRGIALNDVSFNSTFENLPKIGFKFNNILNINKIQLNNYLNNISITDITITNQNKSDDELMLFGNMDYTIGNITLGQQDLGFSSAGISYENLPIIATPSMQQVPDQMNPKNTQENYTKFVINKYFWQNAHGIINMNLSMLLNNIDLSKMLYFSDLHQNNIVSLDFSISIPFAPLIYQFAQIQHPEKNTLSKSDLQYAYQSIMLLSALLQNASSIELIYEATPIKQPGIYSTLHYDIFKEQAMINGKKINTSEFFNQLKLTK